MMSAAGSRRDIGRHLTSQAKLTMRRLRQQCYDQIFKRYDPNAKVRKLNVRRLRTCGPAVTGCLVFLAATRSGPSLVVPRRKRHVLLLRLVFGCGFLVCHFIVSPDYA
jgi:hypothetical protein